MVKENTLPVAPVDRLMRGVDPDIRVSERASEKLRDILEQIAEKVSAQAIDLAKYRGKKTVMPQDIDKTLELSKELRAFLQE